jgi:DNA-binding transcriptional MerR regulator
VTKSSDAFRTISEVAAWLETRAHVLRFWESKFDAVSPVQRTGGRRYYRKSDMTLLGGIKFLLHERGMTIKAVQKLLKDEGVAHLQSFSPKIDVAEPLKSTEIPMVAHVKDAALLEPNKDQLNKALVLPKNLETDEQPLLFPELEKLVTPPVSGLAKSTIETVEPIALGANLPQIDPQITEYMVQHSSGIALLKLSLEKRRQITSTQSEVIEKLRNIHKMLSA